MRRGTTALVCAQQAAFTRFYAQQKLDDPSFHNRTFWVDVCSFNQQEVTSDLAALGPIGQDILGEAPSDRGKVNNDFVGAINRVKGLVAPYVYEGAWACR